MTVVLEFLQMKAETCALSTIRGYITAISGRHNAVVLKGKPHTISHLPSVKTWLSGLERLKGFKRPKAPEWNLEVVLAALAKPPFEPLHKARHKYLTMKAAFLVAITSAKRVSEIHALDERSLLFCVENVSMDTLFSYRTKVNSAFHANCRIVLPAHRPGYDDLPMELCVRRVLKEYQSRTKKHRPPGRVSNPLFLCHAKGKRHLPASKQTIARWLQDTIIKAYTIMDVPEGDVPKRVKAHSTRKMATSIAFENGVDIETICNAATWQTPKTFFKFYHLDVARREDSVFGLSVIQSTVAKVRSRYHMLHPPSLPTSPRPRDPRSVPSHAIPSTSRVVERPSSSQAPSQRRFIQTRLSPTWHPATCRCDKCLSKRRARRK